MEFKVTMFQYATEYNPSEYGENMLSKAFKTDQIVMDPNSAF